MAGIRKYEDEEINIETIKKIIRYIFWTILFDEGHKLFNRINEIWFESIFNYNIDCIRKWLSVDRMVRH